jgi:hypothetical protein
MGVGVTHASFGNEVQSKLSQLVRIIGFFRLAPSAQPQETQGEESATSSRRSAGDIGMERKPFGMVGDRRDTL